MTSLGGKDLQERHPRNANARSNYVPIHPSNAHPDNDMRLYLAGNQELPKNSYVVTKPCRTIKAALLKPWRHEKYRLSVKSLQKLIKHIGFESPFQKVVHVHLPVLSRQLNFTQQPVLGHKLVISPQPVISPQSVISPEPVVSPQPVLNPQYIPKTQPILAPQSVPKTQSVSSQKAIHTPKRISALQPAQNSPLDFGYNCTVPAVSCASNYQRSVGWVGPHDRPIGHPFSIHEHTTLLQPKHRPYRPRIIHYHEALTIFAWFCVIIAALVLLAWQFDVFQFGMSFSDNGVHPSANS
jgi:hypothetical protein